MTGRTVLRQRADSIKRTPSGQMLKQKWGKKNKRIHIGWQEKAFRQVLPAASGSAMRNSSTRLADINRKVAVPLISSLLVFSQNNWVYHGKPDCEII